MNEVLPIFRETEERYMRLPLCNRAVELSQQGRSARKSPPVSDGRTQVVEIACKQSNAYRIG